MVCVEPTGGQAHCTAAHHRVGGKLLKKYKGVDYSVTISEVFKDTCEVYYDVVSSWGRD